MMRKWLTGVSSTDDKGKVLYHNAFVTNYELNETNVIEIIKVGRTRWKKRE